MTDLPATTERAYSRAPALCPVDIARKDDVWQGTLRNISLGGVFVETDRLPKLGATVKLSFSLNPETEVLAVRGRVVRKEDDFSFNNRTGMGILLVRPSQVALETIESYVRRMRRLLRTLKLELEAESPRPDRIQKLAADTNLDLPEDHDQLMAQVQDHLFQFRLRGGSKLRKTDADAD